MELKLIVKKMVEDRKVNVYKVGNYSIKTVEYPDNDTYITVCKETNERYFPDIYCRQDDIGKVLGFEIQTTSYGAISVDEIKKMTSALNEAVEIIEVLENNFVK